MPYIPTNIPGPRRHLSTVTNYVSGQKETVVPLMVLSLSDDHQQLLWGSPRRSRRPRQIMQFSTPPLRALYLHPPRRTKCLLRATPRTNFWICSAHKNQARMRLICLPQGGILVKLMGMLQEAGVRVTTTTSRRSLAPAGMILET